MAFSSQIKYAHLAQITVEHVTSSIRIAHHAFQGAICLIIDVFAIKGILLMDLIAQFAILDVDHA